MLNEQWQNEVRMGYPISEIERCNSMNNGETLTGLLKKGQKILAQAGIAEAGLDAWLLLEYTTGKSRIRLFLWDMNFM